jgi:hypothetical protein
MVPLFLLKYYENTAVFRNTTVWKTVRCLALTNIAVFKTIVFPKLWYFCSIEKRGPTLFFLKLRNEKNDASYIARVSKSPPYHMCSRSSLGAMEKHMGASRKHASPRPSLR